MSDTTACPRCGHSDRFIGTLAAFALGIAFGVIVRDIAQDQRDAGKLVSSTITSEADTGYDALRITPMMKECR